MKGKFIAGALIGAAAGIMFLPEMSRGSRRKLRRTRRAVVDVASDVYDNMKNQWK
ncbi:MAG TPA: YtxH domain-containing protein [Clostridiaceae bacterium]